MSPAKLSEADKNEILQLYRETEETTATLSTRFGVSSSTISRFLKNQLSDGEYEDLIQQKRLGRTIERNKEEVQPQQLEISLASPSLEIIEDSEDSEDSEDPISPSPRRRRSRANEVKTVEETITETITEAIAETISTIESVPIPVIIPPIVVEKPIPKQERLAIVEEIIHEVEEDTSMANIGVMFGEDLTEDDLDDDFDDDEDDEDDDFDDDEALEMLAYSQGEKQFDRLQILPFDRASVPRTCYLVVDRMAELITRPLREFGDLGAIPNEDIQAKTLPIFDNHRVARRFSHRTQRVIKVPDAPRLLEKTSSHLQAKGITRLLLDGRVYRI